MKDVIDHYDKLIDESNDPVLDPKPLKEYMDKWDGDAFIESMCLNESKSVLEIGVGTGRLALKVAPRCKRFYGIDISPKTVQRASQNLSSCLNVKLICDDFMTVNFSERFDVIYSSLTFMHIADKLSCIEKIASLLDDNGILVLSLDKTKNDTIDMGTRKIKIYPDDPDEILEFISRVDLKLINVFETEFAHVVVSKK